MRALPLVMVAMLALVTSACGTARPAAANQSGVAPREITINATEMAFSPAAIELTAGQPVKLMLQNNGVVEHTWQTAIDGETIALVAAPHQSASKSFTPRTPGTYKVLCTEPGHEQAGMVATVTVR